MKPSFSLSLLILLFLPCVLLAKPLYFAESEIKENGVVIGTPGLILESGSASSLEVGTEQSLDSQAGDPVDDGFSVSLTATEAGDNQVDLILSVKTADNTMEEQKTIALGSQVTFSNENLSVLLSVKQMQAQSRAE